jgi:hypothetical protein
MRGAGIHEATPTGEQQWNRPNRPRAINPIFDEPKLRWTEELAL